MTQQKKGTTESELRPESLREYIGQRKAMQALELFISAAGSRGATYEHVLLYGPPGMGKTTLSHIIARELKGELKTTSGPAISKTGDLAAILTNLSENDVLFIDEIHRLPKAVEEALYPVLEDFALDIIIGKGPAARTMRLTIPNITVIGATTRLALLSAPLRDRFGMLLRLDYYDHDEMIKIITRTAKILDLPLDDSAASLIADRSRRTPRIANRILKRIRDYYEVNSPKKITKKELDDLFQILDIDSAGLTDIDIKYLSALITKFEGGPTGVNTLAVALGEDVETLEDFVEPYLLQTGLIQKTARGRKATRRAYQHLGLSKDVSKEDQQKLI